MTTEYSELCFMQIRATRFPAGCEIKWEYIDDGEIHVTEGDDEIQQEDMPVPDSIIESETDTAVVLREPLYTLSIDGLFGESIDLSHPCVAAWDYAAIGNDMLIGWGVYLRDLAKQKFAEQSDVCHFVVLCRWSSITVGGYEYEEYESEFEPLGRVDLGSRLLERCVHPDEPASMPAGVKQYRKRPIGVDAIQYTGENGPEISEWINKTSSLGCSLMLSVRDQLMTLSLGTMEGTVGVRPGDYIIRGVAGEFYPCRPEVFRASYEEVKDVPVQPQGIEM